MTAIDLVKTAAARAYENGLNVGHAEIMIVPTEIHHEISRHPWSKRTTYQHGVVIDFPFEMGGVLCIYPQEREDIAFVKENVDLDSEPCFRMSVS